MVYPFLYAIFLSVKKRKTPIFLLPKLIFMTSGKEDRGSSRTTTRKTRKRRKTPCDEQRDSLWDVVVKWDDICFKHILPRLNRTDLKFLHGVNTETRKLIKRSSREEELKWKFKVSEMSSISTLEVAWENRSLWSGIWDERSFSEKVARTNKLGCSSGYERRKSVSVMNGRLLGWQNKVIWKWSSIALQMSVPSIGTRVHVLP